MSSARPARAHLRFVAEEPPADLVSVEADIGFRRGMRPVSFTRDATFVALRALQVKRSRGSLHQNADAPPVPGTPHFCLSLGVEHVIVRYMVGRVY